LARFIKFGLTQSRTDRKKKKQGRAIPQMKWRVLCPEWKGRGEGKLKPTKRWRNASKGRGREIGVHADKKHKEGYGRGKRARPC